MKKFTKVLAILAIFVAGLSFTSCKKCIECEVEFLGSTITDEECYSSVAERKEEQKQVDKDCAEINANGGKCKCSPS